MQVCSVAKTPSFVQHVSTEQYGEIISKLTADPIDPPETQPPCCYHSPVTHGQLSVRSGPH